MLKSFSSEDARLRGYCVHNSHKFFPSVPEQARTPKIDRNNFAYTPTSVMRMVIPIGGVGNMGFGLEITHRVARAI